MHRALATAYYWWWFPLLLPQALPKWGCTSISQLAVLWGKMKKALNFTIANNEQSLLKLHQALIRFKVMKKTTRSIIINPKEVNLCSRYSKILVEGSIYRVWEMREKILHITTSEKDTPCPSLLSHFSYRSPKAHKEFMVFFCFFFL